METTILIEQDKSPRGFLLSEPKAILQTIIPRDDDSDSEDLPSTVDIEALKEPLLPANDDTIHMGQWRNNATPRAKPKVYELPKKDQQLPNGLENESHSEKSRDSDGSSSDTDSDSESDSGSGSSSSESSGNSSGSSDSSDSDSDTPSNKSSCHSMPTGGHKPTASLLSLSLNKKQTKGTHSRSNSSTSSRSRKSKQFSISQSTYEPGSLKLKIAALKLPQMQHQQSTKTPERKPEIANETATVSNKCLIDMKIATSPKCAELRGEHLVEKTEEKSTSISVTTSNVQMQKELEKTPVTNPRRSSRCSRAKSCGESPLNVSNSPLTNGISSSLKFNSLPPKTESKRHQKEVSPKSSNPSEPSPSLPSAKESEKQVVRSTVSNKQGHTSSLNDNVTMTANNGFNITHKRNTRIPINASNFHSMNSMYQIKASNINGIPPVQHSEHILDPVLRLTKNSDLTIFAINPPKPSNSNNKPSTSSVHSWNSNQDLVMITATGTGTPNNSNNQSSPLRSSRRLSAQRRSIDKSDFESWDSSDANAAVQAAIQRIDSEVINSSKSTSNVNSGSNTTTVVSNCSHNSSTNKKYNSSLLEKFTEMLTSPQGNVSPKIGDVSIEPIMSSKSNSCFNKSKTLITGSQKSQDIPISLPINDPSVKRREKQIQKLEHTEKIRIVPETQVKVKINRLGEPKKLKKSLEKAEKPSLSKTLKTQGKLDKNDTVKSIINGNTVMKDETIIRKQSHPKRVESKVSVAITKTAKQNKKARAKLGKLSIFVPMSRPSKILRSNGKVVSTTTPKNTLKINTREPIPLISEPIKLKAESKNTDKVKTTREADKFHKDTEIKRRTKSECKANHLSANRDSKVGPYQYSGSNKREIPNQGPFTNTQNGPIKPESLNFGPQTMPPMIKTKGAKKYIPENENHLVSPNVLPDSSVTVGGENKTPLFTLKKKSKKSRAKDKKDKNKLKKQKISPSQQQVWDDLCKGISHIALKGSPAPSSSKVTKKQHTNKRPRFTFEKIIFKNIFTPLIPNNEIPPPPYERISTKIQIRSQLNPRGTLGIHTKTCLSNSVQVRKRKQGNERQHAIGDSSDTTLSDSSSANTSSSELQRLPLKKRHHHATIGSGSSGQSLILQESSLNFDEDGRYICGTRSRYVFGGRCTFNSKVLAAAGPMNAVFGNTSDLLNRQKSQVTDKSSTSGDKDKNKTELSLVWTKLDFASLAAEAKVEKKTSNENARKKPSGGSVKKDKDKSPKVNSNSVSSTEPPCEKRRSVRVRKPRILDGEILESPGKSSSTSPSKALKPEIRELASKIEASITPVMNESKLINISNNCHSFVMAADLVSPKNASEKSRKRGSTHENSMGEIREKVAKFSRDHVNINGTVKKVSETEVITIDDDEDNDVVQLELENPDNESGIEVVTTLTNIPMPLISPTSSTGVPKKRRKVNKTGFPVVKKKKKISSGKLNTSYETRTPSTSGVESVDVDSDDVIVLTEKAAAVPSSSRRKKSSLRKSQVVMENQFSLSLTERVKIRKRNSVDGNGSCDDGNDGTDIPGVSPALLNIPDAPIIIPEKNNWLPAGLLSNFYKQSMPTKKKSGRKPKFTDSLLPPPAYCQQFVRQRVVDYSLPYDVWCLGVIRAKQMQDQWREEQQAKAAAEELIAKENKKARRASTNHTSTKPAKIPMPEIIPPSWHFKKIRTNVYYGMQKPPTTELDMDQMCTCPEDEQKCSADDCLNRVVYSECPVACGEKCTNRRIQKHDWAPSIKRVLTENKGYGVFTQEKIKKGDFILEYVGEVVPDALFKERMHTIYANDTHHYCLQLDGGMVIDGHRAGGEGRFVNHSCEPNCEMQKWVVSGLSRMALFALRDIEENEELSYDYNFSLFNPAEGQPCHCGSTKCRGVIGGRTKTLKDAGRPSKRKSKANIHGLKDNVTGNVSEPSYLDKMKVLTRKERLFIQNHSVFLVRNYYTIRHMRGEVEDKVGHRLEKIITSWATRYKTGSNKIKPLILPDDDPELARMARISQILYILLTKLTTERDESGSLLCSSFMTMPTQKKSPQFYLLFDKVQEPMDFTVVRKKILRGEYKTLIALENDIGTVLSSFCAAYEKEKPNLSTLVDKIKSLYMKLKVKAMAEIEPFIIVNGRASELPNFVKWEQKPEDDVIRCICETFSEEGMMIQCEKCFVWQHADCVRVSHTYFNGNQDGKRRRKGKGKLNESRNYAVIPLSSPFNNPKSKSVTPVITTPQVLQSEGEGEVDFGDLVISVKDELPMMICEDNSVTDQDAAKNDEKVEIKTPGSVSELPDVPVSEMNTQRIDDADLFSPVKSETYVSAEPKTELKNETSQQKDFNTGTSPEAATAEQSSTSTQNESYECERCNPRGIDVEVPLGAGHDTPEKKHFLCLVREDGLMLHKNDTVYVLRDSPPEKKAELEGKDQPRLTYQTAGLLVPSECDIFRIESLWKDAKGARFVFGYHYLRPNETFHEPQRRFYPNEILRAPLFEVISIDLIHGRCWVVDPATYCKGRPIGCLEDHLYICEYRVDKSARSFSKVGKNSQSVCTKPFAFNYFETKLKIQRNIHPHGPPSPDFRVKPLSAPPSSGSDKYKSKKGNEKPGHKSVPNTLERLNNLKKRASQKDRVYRVLDNLHKLIPDFKNESNYIEKVSILQTGRKKPAKKFSNLM